MADAGIIKQNDGHCKTCGKCLECGSLKLQPQQYHYPIYPTYPITYYYNWPVYTNTACPPGTVTINSTFNTA